MHCEIYVHHSPQHTLPVRQHQFVRWTAMSHDAKQARKQQETPNELLQMPECYPFHINASDARCPLLPRTQSPSGSRNILSYCTRKEARYCNPSISRREVSIAIWSWGSVRRHSRWRIIIDRCLLPLRCSDWWFIIFVTT